MRPPPDTSHLRDSVSRAFGGMLSRRAHTHTHTHIHTHTLTRTHTHTYPHAHRNACTHTHRITHTQDHTQAFRYKQIENTRMHACTHAHTHARKHTHTHTHTQTHSHLVQHKSAYSEVSLRDEMWRIVTLTYFTDYGARILIIYTYLKSILNYFACRRKELLWRGGHFVDVLFYVSKHIELSIIPYILSMAVVTSQVVFSFGSCLQAKRRGISKYCELIFIQEPTFALPNTCTSPTYLHLHMFKSLPGSN